MERLVRLPAAALLLLGGFVHLQVWQDGYRAIPNIGPLFLVNVAASTLIAVALVLRPSRWVAVLGVGLALASLSALVMSRTVGLLGFTERVWTDDAFRTVAAEVGATVAIALLFVVKQAAQRLADPAELATVRR